MAVARGLRYGRGVRHAAGWPDSAAWKEPAMALADVLRLLPLMLALLASALMAGFFYAYSVSVMPGLAASEPLAAVQAMRGINAVIRTPVFAAAFFGALALPLLAAVLALAAGRRDAAALALAGALAYGLGVVAVTFAVNVPLNDALAAAPVSAEGAPALWQGYAGPWTAWNHLRTLASMLAFACVAAALCRAWR
jgi:uncharacterized membrane protein